MNIILAILLTSIISSICCYLILRPKLKQTQQLDKQTEQNNKKLSVKAEELKNLIINKTAEEKLCENRIEVLKNSIKSIEEQSKTAADLLYDKNIALATERLNVSLELESQKYQKTINDFQDNLEIVQEEAVKQFAKTMSNISQQCKEKEEELKQLQLVVANAVEAAKRKEEIESKIDFYKIQLTDWEQNEIEILRSITPKLKNTEPLNKVIWKCYYEKPTTDLIGRVIGSGIHTGIYKITNIINQKCYVGQAVNLSDRWKQHIKRGIGAETPTRNKLYPAMLKYGPENFTFEVIEECERSLLDEREDYWQDYFKAKEFGYSIK